MKNIAIILASGTGTRFGNNIPKQFCKIKDKTVIEMSVEAFQKNNNIDEIIVVSNPEYIENTTELVIDYSKVKKVITGGATRQESSYNGVFSVEDNNCNVLIHDCARPFISQEIINSCVAALNKYNAVNVAVESSDTIIVVDEKNIIKSVPERKTLRRCQTPQCFEINLIKKAHNMAKENNFTSATDDCSLILKYNLADIYVVEGSSNNIKITYPEDIDRIKL